MENNMEKVVNKCRNERKFLLDSNMYPKYLVEQHILHNPCFLRPLHRERIVNNLYLDTSFMGNYWANTDGGAIRQKIRIRWYGGNTLGKIEKPILEIKTKDNLLGGKVTYALPNGLEIYPTQFSHKYLKDYLSTAQLPLEIKHILSYAEPTLLNNYLRQYYLSADQKIRLTLDSNLQFFKVNRLHNLFLNKNSLNSDLVIELKYQPEDEKSAINIANKLNFRMTKSSKYVSGLNALFSYLHS
jgi:hypothetical protein